MTRLAALHRTLITAASLAVLLAAAAGCSEEEQFTRPALPIENASTDAQACAALKEHVCALCSDSGSLCERLQTRLSLKGEDCKQARLIIKNQVEEGSPGTLAAFCAHLDAELVAAP